MIFLMLAGCNGSGDPNKLNSPPTILFIEPTTGSVFSTEDYVQFLVNVGDDQTELASLLVEWRIDTVVADNRTADHSGASIFTHQFSVPGDYSIEATVFDDDISNPLFASDSIDISIRLSDDIDDDGDGYSESSNDCDDNNNTIYPGAEEFCNGLDDDCDGETDEGVSNAPLYYTDADNDGYGDPSTAQASCTPPSNAVSNNLDCDDSDAESYPGAVEVCDDSDNDCDTLIDDDDPSLDTSNIWYQDQDQDGWGDLELVACEAPAGSVQLSGDCDDTDASIYPGAPESCDGIDQDCDGDVSEETGGGTWYADSDGDGFGDAQTSLTACTMPAGYSSDSSDCDDTDTTRYPGATEICDGLDQDCDGLNDNNAVDALSFYADNDGDGFGDAQTSLTACTMPAGYSSDSSDCDDTDATRYPGATEICDGLDQDCDTIADNGLSFETVYTDSDGDGYGDSSTGTLVCDSSGLVLNSGDCDDSNSQIYPGAAEDCDGVDNDCDLSVDEDTTIQTWYPDADGDGYGVDGATVSDCTAPAGYAATNDDCDDNDSDRYPYSYERKTSDGQDNDCDSWTDEYDVPAGMSLNSAIAFSSRGGLIVLEDGSYTLTSGGAFQGGTIEIYGSNSSNVVIDLSQSTYFGSVSSSTLVLGGLTLTGGTGYQGSYGIIEVTGGTLELEDVVFDSNSTGFRGGAIGIDSGSLVATDCRFTGNSSGSYAGAIYLGSGASASLTRCIFDQNTASYGGAISTDSNSTLSIENAIFANNTANFGGSLDLDGTNTLSYITFVGNTASSAASAIWGTCDTTATGLVFYDNSNYAVNVCSSFSMSYSLYGTSDLYGGSWVDAGGNLWGANGYSASFSSYSADGVYNDDLRLTGDGVDQADPSCSDVDGSRCDMGAYGGPNAW